ncbi:hypothetical protein FRB98_009518 [Tulasnella sp. 332]|nr:hypothetical protein FRB98_009518 [Tulasnella sp. 332]
MSRPAPRLFVLRHGETEWSLNGRHTGLSDIPLTENGVNLLIEKTPKVVGSGKLLDPVSLGHVFVSPRIRARKTFELLFSSLPELPPHSLSDEAREWDYGEYEGLTPAQIAAKRPGWSIWKDGCPGGESAEQMTQRVDSLIAKIHELHRQYYEDGVGLRDVMVVAHVRSFQLIQFFFGSLVGAPSSNRNETGL